MGPERYEILSPLPPGAGARTKVAWQAGGGGFRRAVVLREIEDGVEVFATPSTPASVLPLLDVVELEGKRWAVYEFVPGVSLGELAAAHSAVERLPSLGLIGRLVVDAGRAIQAVHEFADPLGLIVAPHHGGLSDTSIFVGFDGVTRIMDLGARRRTRFIAPELAHGEVYDARADVFSLGAVLHQVATRFDQGYAVTLARAPSPLEFPPPSTVHPEASPELDAVVMRALMPSPSSRFSSALQLAEEIETVLGLSIFSEDQVRTVLGPLFADRLAALKTLVDPSRPAPAPRASAPKKPVVQLAPEPSQPAIEDLPTQHNIKLPASWNQPQTPMPDFGPPPERAGITRPELEADFDPLATNPGTAVPEAALKKPLGQSEDEKLRARGQEKISTADLDSDQLSSDLKALQSFELEAVPTAIKPRASAAGLARLDDPKKKIPTMELDPSEEGSEPLATPSRAGRKLMVTVVMLLAVIGAAGAVLRPDLLTRLKARLHRPAAPVTEGVQALDAGAEAADPDAGPVEEVVGASVAVDAGPADDHVMAASGEDAGAGVRDGGTVRPPVIKKKKKRGR